MQTKEMFNKSHLIKIYPCKLRRRRSMQLVIIMLMHYFIAFALNRPPFVTSSLYLASTISHLFHWFLPPLSTITNF